MEAQPALLQIEMLAFAFGCRSKNKIIEYLCVKLVSLLTVPRNAFTSNLDFESGNGAKGLMYVV